MKDLKSQELRTSEIARFERNLANWLKLDPADALYHRFQGILDSQIVTLQICGVITSQGATKLRVRMVDAVRAKTPDPEAEPPVGLRLV